MIQHIRHVGSFRNPDGSAWCTIFDGVQPTSGSGGIGLLDVPSKAVRQARAHQFFGDKAALRRGFAGATETVQ
jgi:hypothetical protein